MQLSSTSADGSVYIAGDVRDSSWRQHCRSADQIQQQWFRGMVQTFGSDSYDSASSVIVALDGSVYIAGITSGDLDGHTNGYIDSFLGVMLSE